MTLTSRKLIASLGLGLLATSTLAVGVSGALTSPEQVTASSPSASASATDVAVLTSFLAEDVDLGDNTATDIAATEIADCGFDIQDWDPTPEEVAEFNEWTAEEKALLDAAGVNSTIETDEFGIDYLEWDEADDDAAFAALDSLWDDFDFEDFDAEEWELTPEDVAEINEWTAEEIAALEAAQVPFTVETDEDGVRYPIWHEANDDAAVDALESLWNELDLDEFNESGS